MKCAVSVKFELMATNHLICFLLRKSIAIGGEKVSFKPEEVAQMKQLLPPGIRLLGFKPASVIKMTNHLRSSLFLYPNESYINGSTTLYRALYEKCLPLKQLGVSFVFVCRVLSICYID